MPDFRALLREHLGGASLPPDVDEELTAHLEELYSEHRAAGDDDCTALAAVRASLGNRGKLLRAVRLYKGKGNMRNFIRHILVPGLFATALTMFGENLLDLVRTNSYFEHPLWLMQRHVWFFGPRLPIGGRAGYFYLEIFLLVFYAAGGALAAYLCLRLGGRRRQQFWAALVPAVAPLLDLFFSYFVHLVLFLIGRPESVIPASSLWVTFAGYFLSFNVVPAAALLLGAAPLLLRRPLETLPAAS